MAKTKIAVACQGGGSQTAFTAGAASGEGARAAATEIKKRMWMGRPPQGNKRERE